MTPATVSSAARTWPCSPGRCRRTCAAMCPSSARGTSRLTPTRDPDLVSQCNHRPVSALAGRDVGPPTRGSSAGVVVHLVDLAAEHAAVARAELLLTPEELA